MASIVVSSLSLRPVVAEKTRGRKLRNELLSCDVGETFCQGASSVPPTFRTAYKGQTLSCFNAGKAGEPEAITSNESRRTIILATAATVFAGGLAPSEVEALDGRRANREKQVPEAEYKTLPSGLKYYDVKVGGGQSAVKGSRVAVHYVAKWKGLTFMTSRQGLGVTGGTPYGFDIGSSATGIVLKGLDQGVEGMRVGGERLLIVPPELAYGNRGVQEIPPGATLEFNVELLSIKQDAFGSRVKLVEG